MPVVLPANCAPYAKETGILRVLGHPFSVRHETDLGGWSLWGTIKSQSREDFGFDFRAIQQGFKERLTRHGFHQISDAIEHQLVYRTACQFGYRRATALK